MSADARFAAAVLIGLCSLMDWTQRWAAGSDASPARQWRVSEIELAAQKAHTDPVDGVDVSAVFTGPGGLSVRVAGFWDGQNRWRIRFAPLVPGRWDYVTSANVPDDVGLHEVKGGFEAAPAQADNPLYRHGGFLKVSPDRRYLTYSDGTPFFWLGDTWWFCPSDLVPIDQSSRAKIASMYKHLVDSRVNQGFTVVQIAFLGPNVATGDYSALLQKKLNSAYWRKTDQYLQYAIDRGLMPVIGLGFHHMLDTPTVEQLERVWRYVMARYAAHPIGILICGEYNLNMGKTDPEKRSDADRVQKVLALGQFIKERDPYKRAITVHPWAMGGDQRQAWATPWYDFIMVQGGHSPPGPSPAAYREIYNKSDPKPLLEGECTYEQIHGMSAAVVRRNAYKAIQSGCFGFTYGAHGLWYPTQSENDQMFKEWGKPVPWWEAINFEGGQQMKHLQALYRSMEWWKLKPLEPAAVLENPPGLPRGHHITIKTDKSRTALIYVSGGLGPQTKLKLRPGMLAGRLRVELFDPRNGERRQLASPSGDRELPALPDDQDWMLILRSVQ